MKNELDEIVSDCPKCGENILRQHRSSKEGSIEKYICPGCGFEQWVEVLYPIPMDEPNLDEIAMVRLFVKWTGERPSVEEIKKLRSMFPKYKEMTVLDLKKLLNAPEVFVGEYYDWEANQLIKKGRQLGIVLVTKQQC